MILSHPRILLFLAALLVSAFAIVVVGPQYGIEFTGGTYYQVKLDEKITPAQMETVTSIISQRVDAFGLRDTKVNALGDDLVAVQIAETDPERIAQIEALLKTQARFESLIDGNLLFRGDEIRVVSKNPADGYGVYEEAGSFMWLLPFTLSQESATRFSHGIFHRCTPLSLGQYECDSTYFFIDRPDNAVIIIPSDVYSQDNAIFATGNVAENVPLGVSVDEVMQNTGVQFIIADSNLSAEQKSELEQLRLTKDMALVHPLAQETLRAELAELGFEVKEAISEKDDVPWIWVASGARQAIGLNADITNMDPYVEDIRAARVFSTLSIRGYSETQQDALKELKNLEILLQTGSLPTGIDSISKETISPSLGKEFLSTSLLMGVAAILLVGFVLFFRYRKPRLAVPVIFMALSEVVITVGISIWLGVRLDLASVTGVIAAIGTGLNDQIVILDELLKGGTAIGEATYSNRIKRAFFIIVAAAASIVAALSPIVLLASYGFGKLAGFALTTIIGVFMGILITRPAFSIIAEKLIKSEKKSE